MKTTLLCLFSLLPLCVLNAADTDKSAKPTRQGRALEAQGVRADFVIQADRKAVIIFVDEAGKPTPRGERAVTLKVDGKEIAMESQDNGYISKEPLPKKEPAPIVLQIRASEKAKPANFRLKLDTHVCGGCKIEEYACKCDH